MEMARVKMGVTMRTTKWVASYGLFVKKTGKWIFHIRTERNE
jgi:hypothetical protein